MHVATYASIQTPNCTCTYACIPKDLMFTTVKKAALALYVIALALNCAQSGAGCRSRRGLGGEQLDDLPCPGSHCNSAFARTPTGPRFDLTSLHSLTCNLCLAAARVTLTLPLRQQRPPPRRTGAGSVTHRVPAPLRNVVYRTAPAHINPHTHTANQTSDCYRHRLCRSLP